MEQVAAEYLNKLVDFLAVRDMELLDKPSLKKRYGLEGVDLLILLGNSSLQSVDLVKNAYLTAIAEQCMIVGGIGHSTGYLVDNVKASSLFADIPFEGLSEAEILYTIMSKNSTVDLGNILLETESTNCGDNAVKAFAVCAKHNCIPKTAIIVQDPSMQLRTWASFVHVWQQNSCETEFINYAAVQPYVAVHNNELVFLNQDQAYCSMERYVSLLMGEIPRLYDNENGYGPRGKNYIIHVDVPDDVLGAYRALCDKIGNKFSVRSTVPG